MKRTMFQLLCICCLLSKITTAEQLHETKSTETNEEIILEVKGDEAYHHEDAEFLHQETNRDETRQREDETRRREDEINSQSEEEDEKSQEKLLHRSKTAQHKRIKIFDEIGKVKKRHRRETKRKPTADHSSAKHQAQEQEQEQHEQEHDTEEEAHDEEHHDSHGAHAWSYHGVYGPGNWSAVAADCSADRRRQTPIDIRTSLTKVDETMSDIELVITNPTRGQGITLTNNGHTVNLVFDNSMQVTGGNLGNAYQVAGVHFHWGVSDYTGSEHTVNGKRFPLEMHIVSYDKHRYSDIGEALKGENSLAVLGVLFTISDKDNPAIEPIVSNLMSVQLKGTSTRIRHFNLTSLLPTKYRTNFYRYLGSLTTPPCSEVVIWSVFEHTVGVSRAQMEYFRQLYEGENSAGEPQFLGFNWRPIQQLHDRIVVRSFIHQSVHHPHHPPTEAPKPPPQVNQVAAPAVQKDCQCPTHSTAPLLGRDYASLMTLLTPIALLFSLNMNRS